MIRKFMVVLFCLLLLSAYAWAGEGHEHGDVGMSAMSGNHGGDMTMHSEGGLFAIELHTDEGGLKKGSNEIELTLKDNKGNGVEAADISVVPWMAEHGHGVDERPKVTETGGGKYAVSNVQIIMSGDWQLKISITKGDETDMAVFEFPAVGRAVEEADFMKAPGAVGYDVVIGRKNELPELKPEEMVENGKKIKVFRMTVENVSTEIYPGKTFDGWGFNGSIPGPTIRVNEGDIVRIVLTNNADNKHTLHVHGQTKPVSMDGVPYLGQKPLEKGESYTYEFVAKILGTTWYHCHVDSAHHVDMGMYGAFIVEPKAETLKFDREYIMLLDEFPTAHVHVHEDMTPMAGHAEHGVVTEHEGEPVHEHMGETPKKRDWYPETYNKYAPVYDAFTINGKSFPYTEPLIVKKGEKVRIRIINAGYTEHYIHTHSHKFLVTHRDGQPVENPQRLDTVAVGPGQRADILLEADNPGIWPVHCHNLNHVSNDGIYPGGMLTFIKYVD